MTVLVLFSLALLAYAFGGYLLALKALVWLRGVRVIRRADITPSIAVVISAYNESAVIRRKIENALSLAYPPDQMTVVVVSDASDDGTDDLVAEYAGRGVTLFRQPERRGKTAGLNAVIPRLSADVVVFSDANAMYAPDALLKLVRNFADPDVGCVTGEARYLTGGEALADIGERVYWHYEMHVKRLETALGSMVGGDGAIYGIRRVLWQQLPDNAINDFLNPLQIVAAGWRAVYEPEAVCYEETAGDVALEYRRRIRIVSRSWRAIFQAGHVLNPFKVGLFAWCLVSHKVLRWMSGGFAIVAAVGIAALYARALSRWPAAALALTLAGGLLVWATPAGRRVAGMLAYFAVITTASIAGLIKGTIGRVSGVWATPRQGAVRVGAAMSLPIGRALLAGMALGAVVLVTGLVMNRPMMAAQTIFWVAVSILGYVYLGYPAILELQRRLVGHRITRAPIEPHVCLFIAANDEAAVIEAKLRNALGLDYPADKLDILVASDGSVDETNAIVQRFSPRVRLLAFPSRRGKIAVINEGIHAVSSEVVVFSDANTFLDARAIRALVQNFADDRVGAVSGDVRLDGDRASFGRSEDLYYRYERWLQRAESQVGSMVGVDGALYAIRRELFVAPPDDTILDDMAIPMAIIRRGRRVVFEPQATARERGSESAKEEFARKSRVIAGAMQFLSRGDSSLPAGATQVMFSMISHKALRWFSPAFGACTFAASLVLAPVSPPYAVAAGAHAALVMLGAAGCFRALRRTTIIGLAHYFCLVQTAAGVGFVRGLSGSQSVRWRRFSRVPAEAAR